MMVRQEPIVVCISARSSARWRFRSRCQQRAWFSFRAAIRGRAMLLKKRTHGATIAAVDVNGMELLRSARFASELVRQAARRAQPAWERCCRSVGEGVRSVQIKISARHGHISEATQQFIREKA